MEPTLRHASAALPGSAAPVPSPRPHTTSAATSVVPFRSAAIPSPEVVATFALDEAGLIRDCSLAAERVFGYRPDDLVGRHVSVLVPRLAERQLMQGGRVSPRLAYLSRCMKFSASRRDGRRFTCELFFNCLGNPGRPPLLLIIRRIGDPASPSR